MCVPACVPACVCLRERERDSRVCVCVWERERDSPGNMGRLLPMAKETENVCPYRLPWWLSGKESTCQCRRQRFCLWARKIPHAAGQLGVPHCAPQLLGLCSRVWVKVTVAQLCPALCDPMDYTVHGILQARILEWVVVPFSRGLSQPRDWTQNLHCRFFTN